MRVQGALPALRILFVGDIFARPGRWIVHERLPELQKEYGGELTIANGENAAGGFGIPPQIAEELFELGIDVITTGNHVWDKREIIDYMNSANGNQASLARRVLRPANYPVGSPGFGWYQGRTRGGVPYAVVNLQGRIFMASNDDPFRKADELLKQIQAKIIFVDVHAEGTSEKKALVIGRFLNNMPVRFEPATDDARLCAVVVEADDATGKAKRIQRIVVT